tara:strand:- start:58 stop:249 length:192 start_codon:yes stop_codon:yes gene_type:complete
VKVGDLVKFVDGSTMLNLARYRSKGIILSFDKDDDPMVLWFDSSFFYQPEANFRRHIVVLSEC